MARWQQVRTALALALITLVAAACTQSPTGLADFSCSTGSHPNFDLLLYSYSTRDSPYVKIPVTSVQNGPFDYVLWDVVQLFNTNEPQFVTFADDPYTLGTALTNLNVHSYDEAPGDYGLRVRGRAYSGSHPEGTLVGECFRPVVLTVVP
jgi:hypothetical protein